MKKRVVPITGFGGAAEQLAHELGSNNYPDALSEINHLQPGVLDWYPILSTNIKSLLSFPKLLIIHGRSKDRDQVRAIIQNIGIPNLPDPIIMVDMGSHASSLQVIFDSLASEVDAAIAVVTPDDIAFEARKSDGSLLPALDVKKIKHRARENVWLEIGWFWGRLGVERILILKKGDVAIPSDIHGNLFHQYDETPSELESKIYEFILSIRKC